MATLNWASNCNPEMAVLIDIASNEVLFPDQPCIRTIAQHIAIESTQAQQQIKPRHSTNIPLFAAVLGRVHGFALHKITQELTRLPLSGPPCSECSCTVRQSFGLPCHHEIWEMKAINRTIQLEDIHPHWYFTSEDSARSLELSRPLPVLILL